jgi:hypothetical protein
VFLFCYLFSVPRYRTPLYGSWIGDKDASMLAKNTELLFRPKCRHHEKRSCFIMPTHLYMTSWSSPSADKAFRARPTSIRVTSSNGSPGPRHMALRVHPSPHFRKFDITPQRRIRVADAQASNNEVTRVIRRVGLSMVGRELGLTCGHSVVFLHDM